MNRRISVRVRPLAGRCYTLRLLPWATVGEVRRAIGKKYGIPAGSFDLTHTAGDETWNTDDAEMLEEMEWERGRNATSELCVRARPEGRPRARASRLRSASARPYIA